jgi:O-phosphoseryl-tRNA(Cys) synthetase
MSKITPLMTALHVGHKAEERIKCIDNMLFKKREDTKETILRAFWWYRKNSISLEELKDFRNKVVNMNSIAIIQRLDKLISEVEE